LLSESVQLKVTWPLLLFALVDTENVRLEELVVVLLLDPGIVYEQLALPVPL
jgi:hypothetical protein